MFNSNAMMLIKDLLAVCSNVDPNPQENQVNVTTNGVTNCEPTNAVVPLPRLVISNLNVPSVQNKDHTDVPVCREERNGCLRRNSDTTVK